MRLKFLGIFGLLLAPAFGAVTINIGNFNSVTDGLPLVSAAGDAIDQGGAFAFTGYLGGSVSVGTSSLTEIVAAFTSLDNSPVALNATFDGLFKGQDFNGTLGNAVGQEAYILVGNASTLAASTAFALYDTKTLFAAPDALGNGSQSFNATVAANWVIGTQTAVKTQPGIPGAAYTNGIALVSVPEASTALLGLLGVAGLVRRRR